MQLNDILHRAMERQASDVHLKAGIVPIVRRHGNLRPLDANMDKLTGEQLEILAFSILDDTQKQKLLEAREIDLGYGVSGLGRFRINIFYQRGTIRMVIRNIPYAVPSIEDLMLPQRLKKLVEAERGLILVTGMTGSGKSSTVAAMINHINQTQNKHILTLEDPIEFLIRDRKSLITQREVGLDTHGFHRSLRAALRQDPDIIFIGEMRDKESIETALLAAETGHLVLSTLHTLDAKETINRILSVFEPHQMQQIRYQLAATLRAVISQRLIIRQDGSGYTPAIELLVNNTRVKEMIEHPDKSKSLLTVMEESRTSYGMQSFDQSLMDLVKAEVITYEEAMKSATEPNDFAVKYSGVIKGRDSSWEKSGVSKVGTKSYNDDDIEIEDPKEKTGKRDEPSSGKKRKP